MPKVFSFQNVGYPQTSAAPAPPPPPPPAGSGYDPDAQAFITAAGLSVASQKDAVNQLVVDLKAAGVWVKLGFLYPMVGGTASSNAVNLKRPGTNNLTYPNGATYAATGVYWNGTNQYAATGYAIADMSNCFLAYYNREISTAANPVSIGQGNTYLQSKNSNNQAVWTSGGNGYTQAPPDVGLLLGNAVGTTRSLWYNGVKKTTVSDAATGATGEIIIAAYGGASNFENAECALAAGGPLGLTDAEAGAFYNAVQTFQTTLSRQV